MGASGVESPHPAFAIDRARLEKAWSLGESWWPKHESWPLAGSTYISRDRVGVNWKNPILISFNDGARKTIHPALPDAKLIDRLLSDYQDTISFDIDLNVYPTKECGEWQPPDRRKIEQDVKVWLEVDGKKYDCLQPWIKLDVKLVPDVRQEIETVTYFDRTSGVRGGEVKTRQVVYDMPFHRYQGTASVQFDLNNADGTPRVLPSTSRMAVIVEWGPKSYRATFDFKPWPAFLKQVDAFRP